MSDRKTGFFHSIKDKLFHGEKHVDAEYDAVFKRFMAYHENLHHIKQSANCYATAVNNIFLHSNNAAVSFGVLLDTASSPGQAPGAATSSGSGSEPSPNPPGVGSNGNGSAYRSLSASYRSAHARLTSDRQSSLAQQMSNDVLKPLEDQAQAFAQLQQRIGQRDQLHDELEYYLNKTNELKRERDERTMKGKAESKKDADKLQRNQDKLEAARQKYEAFAKELMVDLNNVWSQREQVLGPAMQAFVAIERKFTEIYAQELANIVDEKGMAMGVGESQSGISQQLGQMSIGAVPGVSAAPGDALKQHHDMMERATVPQATQAAINEGAQAQPPPPVENVPVQDQGMVQAQINKATGEEESKRQRYEQDQKMQAY